MKATYREEYLEDGEYSAWIVEVEQKKTEKGMAIRIAAVVDDQESPFHETKASTLVGPVLAGGSRLAKWFQAVTNQKLEDGVEVDLNDMMLQRVRIVVKNCEGNDGKSYPRIQDIQPLNTEPDSPNN